MMLNVIVVDKYINDIVSRDGTLKSKVDIFLTVVRILILKSTDLLFLCAQDNRYSDHHILITFAIFKDRLFLDRNLDKLKNFVFA